jgi:hypothetical protein
VEEFVTSASCRGKRYFSSPKHPEWVPGVFLPWVKWLGSEAITLSITEVKNEWSYTPNLCMSSYHAQVQL